MATTRKAGKGSSKRAGARVDPQDQAERLSRSLGESAQQIWLAGVGAFGRAQAEGTKLFDGLVREGQTLEKSARRFADDRADVVREAVEAGVGQARERAAGTWERLEHAFEERVHGTLVKLGVPVREDLLDLSRRVDALTAALRRKTDAAPPARASAKPGTRKTAPRKTASTKPAATKAAPKRKAAKTRTAAKATPRRPRAPTGGRAS